MSAMDSSNELLSVRPALSAEQQFAVKLLLDNKELQLQNLQLQLECQKSELKCQKSELKCQKNELKCQKNEWEKKLWAANQKVLLSKKLLTFRSFMIFMRDEFLCTLSGTIEDKLAILAEENPKLCEEWQIEGENVHKIYNSLMQKLNEHAHPFFDTNSAFTLAEDDLGPEELKFIGFLWSVMELNPNNLFLRKNDRDVILLKELLKKEVKDI